MQRRRAAERLGQFSPRLRVSASPREMRLLVCHSNEPSFPFSFDAQAVRADAVPAPHPFANYAVCSCRQGRGSTTSASPRLPAWGPERAAWPPGRRTPCCRETACTFPGVRRSQGLPRTSPGRSTGDSLSPALIHCGPTSPPPRRPRLGGRGAGAGADQFRRPNRHVSEGCHDLHHSCG
jgi:hypothetical protein